MTGRRRSWSEVGADLRATVVDMVDGARYLSARRTPGMALRCGRPCTVPVRRQLHRADPDVAQPAQRPSRRQRRARDVRPLFGRTGVGGRGSRSCSPLAARRMGRRPGSWYASHRCAGPGSPGDRALAGRRRGLRRAARPRACRAPRSPSTRSCSATPPMPTVAAPSPLRHALQRRVRRAAALAASSCRTPLVAGALRRPLRWVRRGRAPVRPSRHSHGCHWCGNRRRVNLRMRSVSRADMPVCRGTSARIETPDLQGLEAPGSCPTHPPSPRRPPG